MLLSSSYLSCLAGGNHRRFCLGRVAKPLCTLGKVVARGAKKGDVLIVADEISLTHDGEKKLFEDLTFSVNAGDKLAVIGPNGSGKSSLLKLLYGLDKHDSGTLTRNKGANIGYLPQEPQLPDGATVLQAVLQSDNAVTKAVQQYQQAMQSSAVKGGQANKELEEAIEKMNAFNAWEVDAEAKRVLEAVGIQEELMSEKVDNLSGGQKKRVALAATLVGRPDLIIMDEPTNHMDVDMIGWMERELKRNELAVVLVTHDRYFMENVCDRMLELDKGRCFMHNFGGPGSYEQFKEARAFRRMAQANAAADAKTLERREKEWVRRQPQGRQAKSQARVRRYYELVDRSRDMPGADTKVDFAAAGMMRQGNKVVNMENVGLQIDGKKIIKNFTYKFIPGERMGIVGPNGAGKSTLLNLIADKLQPTTGKREMGETTVIGYFTQHTPPVPDDLKVISYIREIADTRSARKAGFEEVMQSPEDLLEKLGFPRSRQYQRVGDLSGGEKRRLHLASVLVSRPNVLILDEPTNDLDLSTVEVVEDLVRSYKGVLLVVSHDRAFMDNVADRLMVVKGDGLVRLFEGSYGEYLEMLAEEKQEEGEILRQLEVQDMRKQQAKPASSSGSSKSAAGAGKTQSSRSSSSSKSSKSSTAVMDAPAGVRAAPPKPGRKLSWAEQQEYQKLNKRMQDLEQQRNTLNEKIVVLAQSGSDLAELERCSLALGKCSDEEDSLTERWLELAELAGDL